MMTQVDQLVFGVWLGVIFNAVYQFVFLGTTPFLITLI